ncbi:Serine/threonine-protein kinase rio2, partial [Conglomerata obtusa]
MKLNQDTVWTTKPIELKLLRTIEYLSKHNESVPLNSIRNFHKDINTTAVLTDLCKSKFLRYEPIPTITYRLTISGHDCLAISSLRKEGLTVLGDKVGIGKESDIFYGIYNGKEVAVKFHRLGRTSFRTVRNNRDYHGSKKYLSWFDMSKKSAENEYKYLNMFKNLVDIPEVHAHNRHVVVMDYLVDYVSMYHINIIKDLDKVYCSMMLVIENLYKCGYVHGDFNEFNVMINAKEEIIVIDFPQCVSIE